MRALKILLWHVHGSWTTAFVQGDHEYLLPVLPDRGPWGRGRARTWDWPASAREVTPSRLLEEDVDVVVLQRPEDLAYAQAWLHREPGREVPAVYLEHNAPEPHPVASRHVVAERDDIPLVHVTRFNRLYWDGGRAPQHVIEHGVIDPGHLYTGEIPHAAVVLNEAARRGRMTGTDLVEQIAAEQPVDLFGMGGEQVAHVRAHGDVVQAQLHGELARRRVYLHTTRWTSLGLSLVEAMLLGMPVVALAATEAIRAVPPQAGVLALDPDELAGAVRHYRNDPEDAARAGKAARDHALRHYGLQRFLSDWDRLLEEVTR